jgi:arsenate reductase
LRRFSERFGTANLVDPESRPYRQAGLGWLTMDDAQLTARLLADPRLLRLPLVRAGNNLAVGDNEAAWREWLAGER